MTDWILDSRAAGNSRRAHAYCRPSPPEAIPTEGSWQDTAASNSTSTTSDIFEGDDDGVMFTDAGANQVNSSWDDDSGDAEDWKNYEMRGLMRSSSSVGEFGVSILSRLIATVPEAKAYRLRSIDGGAFTLVGLNTAVSGVVSTGIFPVVGTWYRFAVRVEDKPDAEPDEETLIYAKVWAIGAVEPANWQAVASGSGPGRIISGTVGVLSSGAGVKEWDDIRVSGVLLPAPDYVPPPPPIDPPPPGSGYGATFRSSLVDNRESDSIVSIELCEYGTGAAKSFICDQFWDGSWWIYAPGGVRFKNQSPAWTGEIHGAQINADPSTTYGLNDVKGWDSPNGSPTVLTASEMAKPRLRTHIMFSAGKRAAMPVDCPTNKILVVGIGISHTDAPTGWYRTNVQTGNAGIAWHPRPLFRRFVPFTVIDHIPAQYSIRPPHVSGANWKLAGGGTRLWNKADVQSALVLAKLKNVTPISGQPSAASLIAGLKKFSLAGLGNQGSYTGNLGMPWANQYHQTKQWAYGGDRNLLISRVAMALVSNYPNADKVELMCGLLQLASDEYAAYNHYPFWLPGMCQGGIQHGHTFPCLIMGFLMGFAPYRDILMSSDPYQKFNRCSEICQSIRPNATEVGWINNPTTSPGYSSDWGTMPPPLRIGVAGEPHWCERAITPGIGARKITGKAAYGYQNTMPWQLGIVIASHLLGMEHLWNFGTYLDLIDHYAEVAGITILSGTTVQSVRDTAVMERLFYNTYRSLGDRPRYHYS